jgi:PAS domain S-box-containing protein
MKETMSNIQSGFGGMASNFGTWEYDFVKESLQWSDSLYHMFGYEPGSMVVSTEQTIRLIHPDDRRTAVAFFEKNLAMGGNENRLKVRCLLKNNEVRYMVSISKLFKDSNGKPERLFAFIEDVTDQDKNELALEESESKYKYLFENNPAPMLIWDFETLKILDVNEETVLKYGYTKEEFLQLTMKDIRPPEDIPLFLAGTTDEGTYGRIHKKVWRHVKKNGEIIYVEISGHLMDYHGRRVSFIHIDDVTEKMKAEKELQDNQTRLLTAQKIAKLGYLQLRVTDFQLYWSDELYNIWGVNKESFHLSFDLFIESIYLNDRSRFNPEKFPSLCAGEEMDTEFRIVLPDKTIKWVKLKGKLVYDDQGNALFFEATIQDIDAEKMAKVILENSIRSLEDYKFALDQSSIITIANAEGNITYANEKFCKISQYTIGELMGKNHRIVNSGYHPIQLFENMWQTITSGKVWRGEIRSKAKDGSFYWADSTIVPFLDKNKHPVQYLAIRFDITEKTLFDQKVTKAIIKTQEDERYEIGTELHDNVCQLLAASEIRLGILKKSLPESSKELYDECRQHLVTASKELRNLSHRLAPAFFDDITLEDTFGILLRDFNVEKKYTIGLQFDPLVNQEKLNQETQLNLYRILQEQLRNIFKHAKATAVQVAISIHHENLLMKVSDNGIGFDTTAVKQGIGLANMKRRAELFSGKLTIESSTGNGSTIIVEIPLKADLL